MYRFSTILLLTFNFVYLQSTYQQIIVVLMKRTFLIAALVLPFFLSCEKEPAPDISTNGVTLKVSLENGRNWNEGDQILVNGTSYSISEDFGTPNSTVTNVTKASDYYAVYDYGNGKVTDNLLAVELPKSIIFGENRTMPMVAHSNSENLLFKHTLGFLKLKVTGSATLSKISIQSNTQSMKISGKAEIDLETAASPKIIMSADAYQNVTVDFGKEGLKLSDKEQEISVPLPPAEYEEGFHILLYDAEGTAMETNIDYSIEVKRGEEKTLPPFAYTPGSDIPFEMQCTLENDAFGQPSVWNKSDMVSINGTAYDLLKGEGTANATFGPVMKGDSYVIVSPAKANYGFAANFARVSIPENQDLNTPLTIANPQVGVTNGENVELKYTAGVINVRVSGSNIIESIQLISKDKSAGLSGKMDVNFSGSEMTTSMNNGAKNSIKLNCPGGASTESGKEFRFIVPSGEYRQGFKLVITNIKHQMHVVETGAVTVSRNAKTQLENISWTPSVEDSGNLSAFGWANCYVVSAKGKYTFETKLVDGSEVENIAKVDWLWANSIKGDAKTLISDISYKNGVVTFTASEQEGNILLAAFNSANEIVWSWHIWLTDEPRTINMENMSPKDPSKGFFLMDRNLGATSGTQADGKETYGFFYQWGRKDPFYGGTEEELVNKDGEIISKEPLKNAIKETVCNTKYPQAKWQAAEGEAENGSMDFAVKNPMFLLAGNKTAGDNNWLASNDSFRKDWYAVDSRLWNPLEKTIYDPCPVGYKVPRYGTWNELGTNRGKWTEDYSGFIFTSTSGESTWFPAQGIRMAHPAEGGALSRLGNGNNWITLWTADLSTAGQSCQSHSLNIDMVTTNTQASFDPWGNGLNVRCVKIYEY